MKQTGTNPVKRLSLQFPRSSDRGHIEARGMVKALISSTLDFLGLRIEATLKLTPDSRAASHSDGFPRSSDRGHIEAPTLVRRPTRIPRFPRSSDRGHIEATRSFTEPALPANFLDLRFAVFPSFFKPEPRRCASVATLPYPARPLPVLGRIGDSGIAFPLLTRASPRMEGARGREGRALAHGPGGTRNGATFSPRRYPCANGSTDVGAAGEVVGAVGSLVGTAGEVAGEAGGHVGAAGEVAGEAGGHVGTAGEVAGEAGGHVGAACEVAGEAGGHVGTAGEVVGAAGSQVSDFRTICRVALYERPQELEKLGLMVLNGPRRAAAKAAAT